MSNFSREVLEWAVDICKREEIQFKIVRARKRKLGDFSIHPIYGNAKITINSDLSNELFILTFLHELAHKHIFDKFGKKVTPHGKEWKKHFSTLLEAACNQDLVAPYQEFLNKHRLNPKARIEKKSNDPNQLRLRDLELEQHFKVEGSKMTFKLKKKIRTRYLCQNLENGKLYTINGGAAASVVSPKQ